MPAIPAPVHSDDDVRAFFERIVVTQREPWVAELDGDVVGLLVLDGDDVDQLYVEPGLTSQGIGTALLHHAKGLRPDGLHLWTFQSNTGARRFYERHGFDVVRMTDGDNEEGAPDVLYEWRPAPDGAGTSATR